MRDVQLHESFEVYYGADCWWCKYTPDDGNTFIENSGKSPIEAMNNMFSTVRNRRGRV